MRIEIYLVCETLGDNLDEISNLKGNKDKGITEMMLKCLKTVILTAQNNVIMRALCKI